MEFLELFTYVFVMLNIIMAFVMVLIDEDIKTMKHLLLAILGTVLLIMRGLV